MLGAQDLSEKTDQLKVVAERYQVLDIHFKPERDLIEMGLGGIVTSLMRPGLILEPIRAEHLRKREEFKQLTTEKRALEQDLAANTRMVEQTQKIRAQIAAYQQLAPELFKVRLNVTNQATGKLRLKSGHFDLTGDQALVNDGLLIQEAAQLHLFDPSTWSAPKDGFNTGTWIVKGSLDFLGNTGTNLGNLEVEDTLSIRGMSKVLKGNITTAHFNSVANISLFGALVAEQSVNMLGCFTVQPESRMQLRKLKFGGGSITNHGELAVEGIETSGTGLTLTNTGTAYIDAEQVLPRASEDDPENSARIATDVKPGEWDVLLGGSAVDSDIEVLQGITLKQRSSEYLRLFKAFVEGAPYILSDLVDPIFADSSSLTLKQRATEHRKKFIELYETSTQGTVEEQTAFKSRLKEFEPHYLEAKSRRNAHIKRNFGNAGSATSTVEASTIPSILMSLTNQSAGQVTLKSGRFDFAGDTAFANDGTLVQDHACLHWITGLPGAFNTGTWAVTGSLGLVGYKAEDVGTLEVEETLHVHTTEDALKALGSMSKVKAAKIVMHAPKFTVDDDQQFEMPLELHIQDMFSLQAKLVAPAFVVKAKTLELGSAQGKWGVLSAYQNGMKICVDSFRNMFGHVTAMQDAEITVNGDEFVNGAYSQVSGYVEPAEGAFAYPYPRKRNGAAISVGGPLKISVRGQNALLNNYYGLIQSDGYLDLFSQKQLMNFAGTISSKGGGVLSAPEITVQRDAVLCKECGDRFCDGHYYTKKGCQVRDSCSGGGRCVQAYNYREQSDEGWINVGGGDLEIDTNSLSVLASHIISKNKLLLKRQGIEVPKSEDGELRETPGVLVKSHQDRRTYVGMTTRGGYNLNAIHKAGIFSHSDMELESNGLKIEGISTTKTMDVVKALAQTIQSAGFDVTTDQARDLLIDLTSGAKSQADEPHSLVVQKDGQFSYDVPFERGVKAGYGRGPMPVLTHSYEAFERNLRPNMYLCPTVSQMVLDQLLDNVVLKALRNPRGSDFAQIMYANAQNAAIKNMKRRLLQNKEAASEEEAGAIVVARYNQVIPITHADMSAYAHDMRASAKEMLLFQLGANYRAIEKLKRMEGDLDQEVQELRPQVFIPKGVVSADKTTASVHSDGALNNRVFGDMIMRGAAEYSGHGGTTRGTGNLIAEAVAIRQGSVDNFHEEGAHPLIRNAGTHNTQHILVDGGIALTSARVDTGGVGNVMNMQAQESICEYALPLVDQQTTHSRTKREDIIRIMTRTHMDPLQQIGSGTRTLKSGVVYQQASAIAEDTTLTVEAQQHTHDEVHDQVSVQTIIEKRGKRGWFGTPGSRKTIESLARAYFSQGGKIKGALFSQCDHYKSVNTEYDSSNVVINTPQAEFLAGTNSSSSQTRTIYKGAVWNKSKIESESHSTRSPCQFKQPVTVHGPEVRVEQRLGASAEPNLITDSGVKPTYTKVVDHHDSSSKSQKSLSMGAALVLKLALTLSMGNPFAASSIPTAMTSAGYSTLCGEAMVCLVENNGNPGRAMHALGERNIGKSIVRSMATAGLTKGIGGLCRVTDALTIPNLARQYLIQSAIATTMSVVVDKQNIGDAMRQGATSAVVNTVAAWSAGQIGDLASEKMGTERISSSTQTGLHFATGAAAGGISAAILGGDIGKEALARGVGSAIGHKLAEMSLDMGASMNTAAHLGNIGTVGLAMLTDQDVMAAYQGSSNAIEYNCSRHQPDPIKALVKSVKDGMDVKEGETATAEQEAYERGRQIYVKDSLELARQLNGGSLDRDTIEQVVEKANELYATKYTADLCGAMTGKTIVGASELIPGMRGVNKAWMGVVNHARGELSDGQLADEVLGGIHSALTDAAFCVATAGAAHYYRSAKMVATGVKKSARFAEEGRMWCALCCLGKEK